MKRQIRIDATDFHRDYLPRCSFLNQIVLQLGRIENLLVLDRQ